MFVAVYGTLRKGFGNHKVMESANGEYVGYGKTVNDYDMFNLGHFPSVSLEHSDNEMPVVVEVFDVSEDGIHHNLDMLEGYPRFYNRSIVPVDVVGIGVVDCWIYHIDRKYDDCVKSGDWREL